MRNQVAFLFSLQENSCPMYDLYWVRTKFLALCTFQVFYKKHVYGSEDWRSMFSPTQQISSRVLLCLVKRGYQLNQFQEESENLWEIELKIKLEVILFQQVNFSVFTSKNLFWACFLSNIVRAILYGPIFFFSWLANIYYKSLFP